MRISTKGRYALRLMTDIAVHGQDGWVSLKDAAARQGISVKYLEQIAGILSRAGLLHSSRGAQGGYRLTRAPEEYPLGDILRSLDKEDKSAELEKARVDAVHDARTKAETYAGAAGVRIGDVISISDSSSSSVYYPRANIMYAMAADESASVSTEYRISDITVSSSVSIVYELLND